MLLFSKVVSFVLIITVEENIKCDNNDNSFIDTFKHIFVWYYRKLRYGTECVIVRSTTCIEEGKFKELLEANSFIYPFKTSLSHAKYTDVSHTYLLYRYVLLSERRIQEKIFFMLVHLVICFFLLPFKCMYERPLSTF